MSTSFTPANAAILLVDHQALTVSWIYSMDSKVVLNNVRMLGRLAHEMGIPHLVTTTMEDGGFTGTSVSAVSETAPTAYANRIKRGGTLNCFDDANFSNAVKTLGRKNLIIAGLTTDICCFQTVRGALREGYTVQVVGDACGSASALADQLTFDRLRTMGVTVTNTNMIVTELYSDFSTEEGMKVMFMNTEEVVSKYGK